MAAGQDLVPLGPGLLEHLERRQGPSGSQAALASAQQGEGPSTFLCKTEHGERLHSADAWAELALTAARAALLGKVRGVPSGCALPRGPGAEAGLLLL